MDERTTASLTPSSPENIAPLELSAHSPPELKPEQRMIVQQGVLSFHTENCQIPIWNGMAKSLLLLPTSEGNDGTERLLSISALLAIPIRTRANDCTAATPCSSGSYYCMWRTISRALSASQQHHVGSLKRGAHTRNCTNRARVAVRNGIVMSTETLINCPAAAAGRHQQEGGGG
jgi:hypothetical protein